MENVGQIAAWAKSHPAAVAGGVVALGVLVYMSGGLSSFASLLTGGGSSTAATTSSTLAAQMAAAQQNTAQQYALAGQQQTLNAQTQIAALNDSYQLASTQVQADAQMQIAADTAGSVAYGNTVAATTSVVNTALATMSNETASIAGATGQGIAAMATQNAAVATAGANVAGGNNLAFSNDLTGAAKLVSSIYGYPTTGSPTAPNNGSNYYGSTPYASTVYGAANTGVYQGAAANQYGGSMPVMVYPSGSSQTNVGTSGSGVMIA